MERATSTGLGRTAVSFAYINGGASVCSSASTLQLLPPSSGAPLPERLRRAEDIVAELKRGTAERDLAIRKYTEDLRYRSRKMLEQERKLTEQAEEIALLRAELERSRNVRSFRGNVDV